MQSEDRIQVTSGDDAAISVANYDAMIAISQDNSSFEMDVVTVRKSDIPALIKALQHFKD